MSFRDPWFTASHDRRWLVLFAPVWVLIGATMAAASCIGLGLAPSVLDIGIWAGLSAVAAAFLCGFGYANLKVAFGFTTAGVVAGLVSMVYVFAQPIAQRGIVGLVTCVELGAVFFMVGVSVQMLKHLARSRG